MHACSASYFWVEFPAIVAASLPRSAYLPCLAATVLIGTQLGAAPQPMGPRRPRVDESDWRSLASLPVSLSIGLVCCNIVMA